MAKVGGAAWLLAFLVLGCTAPRQTKDIAETPLTITLEAAYKGGIPGTMMNVAHSCTLSATPSRIELIDKGREYPATYFAHWSDVEKWSEGALYFEIHFTSGVASSANPFRLWSIELRDPERRQLSAVFRRYVPSKDQSE